VKRKIITINEELCDGCGNCVSTCSEGALQIVNGKARLVKEDFCDGFGDCIGGCPTGALVIEERESKAFDIEATKEYLLKTKGKKAVWQMEEAQKKHETTDEQKPLPCGCPGSMTRVLSVSEPIGKQGHRSLDPQLRNWPVQLHLLPLKAPFYEGAELLVAADCGAYAYAGFHSDFIQGRTLAIGCPKLDAAEAYREKLAAIIAGNNVKSVAIAYMEVPCCSGLVRLAEDAVRESGKTIPVTKTKIGIKGTVAA
jgi:Fe-S-cluster-containing hydrogenase component 2